MKGGQEKQETMVRGERNRRKDGPCLVLPRKCNIFGEIRRILVRVAASKIDVFVKENEWRDANNRF